MSPAAPKKRTRIDYETMAAEIDAELDAMFGAEERKRWREQSAAEAERRRDERGAKEERQRERLTNRLRAQHPNRGKTSRLRKGHWVWSEEVPVSPTEALLPSYPRLMCNAPGVRAKRLRRARVLAFEADAAQQVDKLNGHSPDYTTNIKWDLREEREIEADVIRRWGNAQQRFLRRDRRRAAKQAVAAG